jgi:hypothetical protein
MAISYIYPPTNEPVEKERWRWVVFYTDGSKLEQFEVKAGKAIFHRFGEIDQSRVYKMMLVHDTHLPIIMYPPEGSKLVHAYVKGVYKIKAGDDHVAEVKEQGYKFGYIYSGNDYGVLIEWTDAVRIISDFNAVLDIEGKYN